MISEVANDAVSESGKSVTPSKKMIPVYKSQSQVTRCFITFCLPSNLLYIIHTYCTVQSTSTYSAYLLHM